MICCLIGHLGISRRKWDPGERIRVSYRDAWVSFLVIMSENVIIRGVVVSREIMVKYCWKKLVRRDFSLVRSIMLM